MWCIFTCSRWEFLPPLPVRRCGHCACILGQLGVGICSDVSKGFKLLHLIDLQGNKEGNKGGKTMLCLGSLTTAGIFCRCSCKTGLQADGGTCVQLYECDKICYCHVGPTIRLRLAAFSRFCLFFPSDGGWANCTDHPSKSPLRTIPSCFASF